MQTWSLSAGSACDLSRCCINALETHCCASKYVGAEARLVNEQSGQQICAVKLGNTADFSMMMVEQTFRRPIPDNHHEKHTPRRRELIGVGLSAPSVGGCMRLWSVALVLAAFVGCSSSKSDSSSSSGSTTGTAASGGSTSSTTTSSAASTTTGASSSSTGSSGSTSSTTSTGGSTSGSGSTTGTLPAGAPRVVYTDIVSGPNSGGESNDGAYLSIFGQNFGTSGLGSTVKVTIGGVEVARYLTLGMSLGRSDVEQITVQVGALGSPTAGTPLPIQVTVNGVASNTDVTFTVNPGRILYVDNVNGSDDTAVPGDIAHPYQHVQLANNNKSAAAVSQPGDTIVLRGTNTPYTDLGNGNDFVRVIDIGGSEPTGASGTGPLAFIGYPGEAVNIVNGTGGVSDAAAFSGIDQTAGYSGGNWVTIADLHIEGDGTAGVIALQIASDHWRIVNDELTAPNTNNANVRAAGVNGNGPNTVIYGNSIHDITGSGGESHGVYIDGDGSYDIAYNVIFNVASGYGIQAYNNGGNGSTTTSDVRVHHNFLHDVTGKGCLNIADGSSTGFAWWDNVCANIHLSCMRFNSLDLVGAQVFNNTFYNCNQAGNGDGAVDNDWSELDTSAVTLVNNIIIPASGSDYTGGSGDGFGDGVFVSNVYDQGSTTPNDASAVNASPQFENPGTDFHLGNGSPAMGAGSSTVSATVTNNFELTPWTGAYDIGAY